MPILQISDSGEMKIVSNYTTPILITYTITKKKAVYGYSLLRLLKVICVKPIQFIKTYSQYTKEPAEVETILAYQFKNGQFDLVINPLPKAVLSLSQEIDT